MKFAIAAFIILGLGLGPGAFLAKRRRKDDDTKGRLWLGQVTAVLFGVAWAAALLLIIKEVF